jgi:hypothetical protein
MGFDRKQLKEPSKPIYGFSRKRIEPVGVITLPVSFGTPKNPRTKYIAFDVVDIPYTYNAIFRRGLLNTFEASLHSAYLCLKILATFGIIPIFRSQQGAKNIEKGFALDHKNVHFLQEHPDQHNAEPLAKYKKAIEVEGEFKKVPLDPRVPDKTVCNGAEASQKEQREMLSFLDETMIYLHGQPPTWWESAEMSWSID